MFVGIHVCWRQNSHITNEPTISFSQGASWDFRKLTKLEADPWFKSYKKGWTLSFICMSRPAWKSTKLGIYDIIGWPV